MGRASRRKAAQRLERRRVRITASIAAMSPQIDLQREVDLVKRTLLYADTMSLSSPLAAMLVSVGRVGDLEGTDRLRFVASLPDSVTGGVMEEIEPEMLNQILMVMGAMNHEGLNREARRTARTQIAAMDQEIVDSGIKDALSVFDTEWPEIAEKLEPLLEPVRRDLQPVIDQGILIVDDLDLSSESVIESVAAEDQSPGIDSVLTGYLARIFDIMLDPASYPVFDSDVSALVRAAISDVRQERGETHRLAHAGLGTGILGRVPGLVEAEMEDLLQLRASVFEKGLGYRTAIKELRTQVAALPVDTDYQRELDHLWVTAVEPEVMQLQRVMEEASWVSHTGRAILEEKGVQPLILAGSAYFGAASALGLEAVLSGAISTLVGAASIGAKGRMRSRQDRKHAESSDLFLLAEAGRYLE